ncbi:MAG: malonic semialdehyde reductase [Pseudomonadota bacterium]|nr:malonic semialdehyde reductase [Pseudomonadota bacterium]MEC7958491.1 malonic semialdehyde reductase [Pseudomonadota bacterium]MEC7960947.1 malonic semialdehyde reductase [Pseudomonadota bacterium]MEC8020158.1 malonic semialdehyde reductase [Pseudomonadota bacterium]MEC8797729.1 malonic semialdehyde reductase [Pseudomonadota bacterium]
MSVFDVKNKNLIFQEARTHNDWLDKDISNDILMEIYDLMKWGPTSANCSPTRIIFVKSKASKDRLLPFVIESNLEKTKSAPVTAIIGYDINFHDHLPKLFPHNPDAQNWFNHSIDIAEETAFRNGSMQGAYFIIAARALGLDCGPMSGFDKEGVDNEFFRDTNIKSNFLCNLGYGDKTKLFERSPRFKFNEICEII